MASEQVPSLAPARTPAWFARLGLSGKLLAVGAVAGVIVAFLPLARAHFLGDSQTVLVVDAWQGKVGLAGYLAALLLAFVLYPPAGLAQKALCWAGVGAGLLVSALAIWLALLALGIRNGFQPDGSGVKITPDVGAFLNVASGLVVAAAGFLKAREDRKEKGSGVVLR